MNEKQTGRPVAIKPQSVFAVEDAEEIPADGGIHKKTCPRRTIIRYAHVDPFGRLGDCQVALVSDSYADVMARLRSTT